MKFIVELTDKQYHDLVRDAKEYERGMENEDFNPQDYCGGNFDDCYEMGVRDGQLQAAYELFNRLYAN